MKKIISFKQKIKVKNLNRKKYFKIFNTVLLEESTHTQKT